MQSIYAMIEDAYNCDDNYFIRKNSTTNGLCYIYCSSNALYLKENAESFQKYVIKQNRYEWQNLSATIKPECEIFIRDLWLSWYVRGINATINTYDKLIAFLKEKTKGYRVRCVGASSGGVIGNILAMHLNAECCYCFAGQFSLQNHFDHLMVNPFLRSYLEESGDGWFEYYRYLDMANTKIVYFLPIESKQDQEQYALIKNSPNVITIKVNSAQHGIAIYPYCLGRFISFNLDQCKRFEGRLHEKLQLSIRVGGLKNCFHYYVKKFWTRVLALKSRDAIKNA